MIRAQSMLQRLRRVNRLAYFPVLGSEYYFEICSSRLRPGKLTDPPARRYFVTHARIEDAEDPPGITTGGDC
jgi:hypothetical protein